MTAAADIRLLGPVVVIGPLGPAELVGVRQRTLTGLLALSAGRVVSTGRLVDGLWGFDPPRTALRSLHSHVSRVRQAFERCGLPGLVHSRGSGYLLAVPPDQVDALRFEDAARQARADLAGDRYAAVADRLDAALAAWTGEPFEDGEPGGWAVAEVERLQEVRLAATEDLWEARLHLGDHDAAAQLERMLVEQPYRERLVGLFMRALVAAGRPAEALDRYQRLRQYLADDLGADPGPPLQRLHREILQAPADPVPVAAPPLTPAQLPAPVGNFAGRTAALADLTRFVEDRAPAGRLAVVSGPAGVGKTALVVQWAHQIRDRFPDGQIFLDLRGHGPDTALTAEVALAHVLSALGVPPDRQPPAVADQLGLYRSLVHDRRLLLVLDNGGSADHIRPLAPTGSGSALVVTSRRRLVSLATHYAVARVELEVLAPAESLDVIGRVLGPDRLAAEPAAAAELADLCGHLPLALRIAAARLAARPRLPIAALVAELDSAGRIDALSTEDDSVSLRQVFASAYHALSEPAALLFRRLGLHPGLDVSSRHAAVLAGTGHGRARRDIDELAGAHLLVEADLGRYRLHELVRLYALERASADDEPAVRAEAVDRLLDWFLAVADRANRVLDPGRDRVVPELRHRPDELPFNDDPAAALATLTAEHANLLAATRYAARNGRLRVAWQLSYLMAGYFESRGHAGDRIRLYQEGLAAARQAGDPIAEGLMCSGLGVACIAARRYDEALVHLDAALRLMRTGCDRRGEGHALNNLAAAYGELRRFDEAVSAAEQALAVHRSNGHNLGMMLAYNNLGHLYARTGALDRSLAELARGLTLARQVGDERLQAAILHSTAETHRYAGDADAALDCFGQALALRQRSDNRQYEARTRNEMGVTRLAGGDAAGAAADFAAALAIAEDVDDAHLAASVRANLGRAALLRGDLQRARAELHLALSARRQVPDPYAEAGIQRALAGLESQAGAPGTAARHRLRAVELYRSVHADAEAQALATATPSSAVPG